ncbi:cysteine desulfurase family protein [Candidatus Vidania fulgoroideorum]
MKKIFFNNASKTLISKDVLKTINKSYKKIYNETKTVNANKKIICKIINCEKKEIFFTSGVTEANNISLLGFFKKKKSYSVLTSNIEHKSIINVIKKLKNKKIYLKHNKGIYCLKHLKQILKTQKTNKILATLTWVNNEIGIVQNIPKISEICEKHKVILHVDASQAIGKIKINLKKQKIHLLSFASNKIHGPEGIGLLIIKKTIIKKISPIFYGGNQQNKIRPGNISINLIIAATKAIKIYYKNFKTNKKKIKTLKQYFLKQIKKTKFIKLNTNTNRLINIFNIHIKDINRNYLLKKLKNFSLSFSSYCDKDTGFSYILKNMSYNRYIYKNSIRLAFSIYNKKKEIDYFCSKIKETYIFCKKFLICK